MKATAVLNLHFPAKLQNLVSGHFLKVPPVSRVLYIQSNPTGSQHPFPKLGIQIHRNQNRVPIEENKTYRFSGNIIQGLQ